MKNIKIIYALFFLFALAACKNEYVEPNQYSDVTWRLGGNSTIDGLFLNVGKYASFADLSLNAVSHKWEIMDEGCQYLKGPITSKDEVYDEFIISEAGKISEDKTVHVLFNGVGIKRIRLYNEFTEPVKRNGWDTTYAVFNAEKNLWIVDTALVIEVFDTLMEPAYLILDTAGVPITFSESVDIKDPNTYPTINIGLGESLTFIDTTKYDRPDSREWDFEELGTSEDSIFTVQFTELGESYTRLYFSAKREGEEGGIPAAKTRVRIPLKINVGPSNSPFNLAGDISVEDKRTISIPLTGSIADLPTDAKDAFTVLANNISITDHNIPIASVGIGGNGTILTLKTEEDFYFSDTLTISYADGSIRSVDTRSLMNFNEELVGIGVLTNADVSGFETEHAAWVLRIASGWTTDPSTFEITNEKAHSGSYCMKFIQSAAVQKGGVNNESISDDNKILFTSGITIKISYYYQALFNAPSTNGALLKAWFQPSGFNKSFARPNTDLTEWTLYEGEFDLTHDGLQYLDWGIISKTDDVVVWIDDYKIEIVDPRP